MTLESLQTLVYTHIKLKHKVFEHDDYTVTMTRAEHDELNEDLKNQSGSVITMIDTSEEARKQWNFTTVRLPHGMVIHLVEGNDTQVFDGKPLEFQKSFSPVLTGKVIEMYPKLPDERA